MLPGQCCPRHRRQLPTRRRLLVPGAASSSSRTLTLRQLPGGQQSREWLSTMVSLRARTEEHITVLSMDKSLIKSCTYCGSDYSVQCKSRMDRSKYCSKSCRQKQRCANGEVQVPSTLGVSTKGRTYGDKQCASCSSTYTRTSPKQVLCIECGGGQSKWANRWRRYKVSKTVWDEMLAKQCGVCAICKLKEPDTVDHCHETGKTRGLLCTPCNTGLHYVENTQFIKTAGDYIAIFQ